MSVLPSAFVQLVESLTILPGIGPKSAQRMAIYLLMKKPQQAKVLAETLADNLDNIKHCTRCQLLCETDLCRICSDANRDQHIICVVENISDLLTLEQTGTFRGLYFVLMGSLSPIDRIGPEELGIPGLLQRIQNEDIHEVILANNPTIEGEATAHFLASKISKKVKVTRLASGIPIGTELTYVNDHTIHPAIACRKEVNRPTETVQ